MSGSLTSCLTSFRNTRNPTHLLKAAILAFKQGRIAEIFRSGIHSVMIRPSAVKTCEGGGIREPSLLLRMVDPYLGTTFDVSDLVRSHGEGLRFSDLPGDFQGTRWSCVCRVGSGVLIGEYNDGKRLFLVSRNGCVSSDFYHADPRVRHIHSIACRGRDLFVSTGDSRKALDLWTVDKGRLLFIRRLRKRSAGYTAAVPLGCELFFGTDFSSRPNWIETLSGKKFPFPKPAFLSYTEAMQAVDSRYLVSVNKSMMTTDRRKAWSVFDTWTERFLFCKPCAR